MDVKRTICKGCRAPAIPGVNTKVRIKKKHVIWRCCVCNTKKVYKATPDYAPWTLRQEAVVDVLDYSVVE